MNLIYVFLGGGAGALMRYLVQIMMGKQDAGSFPMATFFVNILGCFIIGLLAASTMRFKWNEQMVLLIFTGILGGFTTFSSFSLDFIQLMKNNQGVMAFLYVGLSNFAGLALCALGYYLLK